MEKINTVFTKGAAGKRFKDLAKACADNFERLYPEFLNDENPGTYMCPPVFKFGYEAPIGQASGAKTLSKVEEDTIRGDDAELKLFHILEKFGNETHQPMFVITQLKFSEFLKNVLKQKLPEDHPVFRNDFTGELDFILIHRNVGVILIEVKSKKKFSKGLQNQARKQLQNGENIIKDMLPTHDDDTSGVPVYKVIAMPNVNETVRGNGGPFRNLRAIDIESSETFCSWWKSQFPERKFDPDEKRELQNILSILVAQRSEVSSTVITKVCDKIDAQHFLEKSYNKGMKHKNCQSSGIREDVSKTSEHEEQSILSKQFLFLNPDQMRVWNGERHQFFNGSSGSGKTILLQYKALECAKAEEKVIVVIPVPLKSGYQTFFSQNGISKESAEVVSPDEFFQGNYLEEHEQRPFHFFADEFQTFKCDVQELVLLLKRLIETFAGRDQVCWVAYDYMQKNASGDATLDETGGLAETAKLKYLVLPICKENNFVHSPCLTTVVRSTMEIYNYVQNFIKSSLDEIMEAVWPMEHIDKATKEYWFKFMSRYGESNHIGHRVSGPSVDEVISSSLENIVCIIESEINKWSPSGSLNRVAVLLSTAHLKEELTKVMSSRNIPVREVESQVNGVVVDYGHKTYSYEWPLVIAFPAKPYDTANFLGNYTMFTRAMIRLVVVTYFTN